MPLGSRVLLALAIGFCFGALLPMMDAPALTNAVDAVEPIGAVWLTALRMTVLPLVFALLVVGVGTVNDNVNGGRVAARALALFVVLLTLSAIAAAVLTPLALSVFPVDPGAAAALRGGVVQTAHHVDAPPLARDWLLALIPSNPFEAAAKGNTLQLVTFALLFGLALGQIATALREHLLQFFQAIVEAMLVIVRWVLRLAPIGVFVLAADVGRRGGFAAAGALGHYLAIVCGASLFITALLYPVVRWRGGVPMRDFARGALPVQILAFSTQSSLACLSAMIDATRASLRIPPAIGAVTLPLAVSLFRITSPIVNLSIVLFVAHVNGVPIGMVQLIAGVVVAVVTNFAIVGLPSQITFFTTTVPISAAMGVPTDLLPLLLAVEVISDLFRTVGNVTGDLAVTVLMHRRASSV